jgi:hypothetical protein
MIAPEEVEKLMKKGLFKFKCQNVACEKRENFVELPEDELKRIKFLLYCGNCGHVVLTYGDVEIGSDGEKWLLCTSYLGTMRQQTRGPVQNYMLGYVWGSPDSNDNLSEVDFMMRYGINPRIEWCKRSNKNCSHPICQGKGIEKIMPVKFSSEPLAPCVYDNLPGNGFTRPKI